MKKILIFGGLSVVLVLVIINLGGKWILSRQYRSVPAPEGEEVEGVKVITVTDKDARIKKQGYELKWIKTLESRIDTNLVFDMILKICCDSESDVYMADRQLSTIKKYNNDFQYTNKIGGPGQGPGEFSRYFNLLISHDDSLYVYDPGNSRLSVIDTEGNYSRSIRINHELDPLRGKFTIDEEKNIYVSYYDPENEKVIHKFNSNGVYIKSFGEKGSGYKIPLSFYGSNYYSNFSIGHLGFDDQFVYFARVNPVQIYKYSLEGKLLMVVNRISKYIQPHKIEQVGDGSFTQTVPTATNGMIVLNGYIFISIFISPKMGMKEASLLEVYTKEGELIFSRYFKDKIRLAGGCDDKLFIIKSPVDDYAQLSIYRFQ